MAVYDNPAYEYQTLYKVNGYVCLRSNAKTVTLPALTQFPRLGEGANLMRMSSLGIVNHPFAGPSRPGFEDEHTIFVKRMLDQGRSVETPQDLQFFTKIGDVMACVLSMAGSWSSDHAAVQHLMGYFWTNIHFYEIDRGSREKWRQADQLARDILPFVVSSDDFSEVTLEMLLKSLDKSAWDHPYSLQAKGFAEFCEKLLTSQSTKESSFLVSSLRNNPYQKIENAEVFKITHKFKTRPRGELEVYSIMGIKFMILDGKGYLFDRAHLLHLRECSQKICSGREFALAHRVCGAPELPSYLPDYQCLEEWMGQKINCTWPLGNDLVARSMKDTYYILLNKLGVSGEAYRTGVEMREQLLLQGYAERNDGGTPWYVLAEKMTSPDRERLDLMTIFYMLPPPDYCPYLLYCKTLDNYSNSNPVNSQTWARFMDYSKGVDLGRASYKSKTDPNFKCVAGYEEKAKAFIAKARHTPGLLPDKEERGKYWLHRHYPYMSCATIAHFEPNDVTRVQPDLTYYEALPPRDREAQYARNELLDTIRRGPILGGGLTADQVREQIIQGTYKLDKVGDLAGKAEASKDKVKVRETTSADSNTREMFSELDKACIVIARDHPTVFLRKSERPASIYLQDVVQRTSRMKAKTHIVMSMDMKAFSPKMNRDYVLKHHDYLLSTTCAPKGLTFTKLYENLELAISKRGIYGHQKMMGGLCQGFEATANSLLNCHAEGFAISELKESKILRSDERGMAAALIDDGVLEVLFSKLRSPASCQEAVTKIFDHIVKTFKDIGLVISLDKTILSSVTVTFLGRVFTGGSELANPLKTMMRVFRSIASHYTNTPQQMLEIFNTYRGCLRKGVDPLVGYALATRKAMGVVVLASQAAVTLKPHEAAITFLTPVSNRGWGCPTLAMAACKESTDHLSRPISLIHRLMQGVPTPTPMPLPNKSQIANLAAIKQAILLNNYRLPSAWSFIQSPTSVFFEDVKDPSGMIANVLKQAIYKLGPSAEVRKALEYDSSQEAEDSLWTVLRSMKADAAVFEQLSAMRPMRCYLDMLRKLLDCDGLIMLVPRSQTLALRNKIRRLDRESLTHLAKVSRGQVVSPDDWYAHWADGQMPPFGCIREHRQGYFDFLQVTVKNHTDPDPLDCVARAKTPEETMLTMEFVDPQSAPRDFAGDQRRRTGGLSQYRDMYNGYCVSGVRRVPQSSGVFVTEDPVFKALPTFLKAVAAFAALCEYLEKENGTGTLLWDIAMALNGSMGTVFTVLAGLEVVHGVSLKRLSRDVATRSHAIPIFPNTQLCVKHERPDDSTSSPLARLCDMASNRFSFLALQTVATMKALVWFVSQDWSLRLNAEEFQRKVSICIVRGSWCESELPSLEIDDGDDLQGELAELNNLAGRTPADYMDFVFESEYLVTLERGPVTAKEPKDDTTKLERINVQLGRAPMYGVGVGGLRANIPRIPKRGKPTRSEGVDISASADRPFVLRIIKDLVGHVYLTHSEVFILAVMKVCMVLGGTTVDSNVALVPHKDAIEKYSSPVLTECFRRAKRVVCMHLRNPGPSRAQAFLTHRYLAQAFGSNEPHEEDSAAAVVVARAAHGALPTARLYTAAVAGDPKLMETCHRTAARRYENKGALHHIYKTSVEAVTGTDKFNEYYRFMHKNVGYSGPDTCHPLGVGLRSPSVMEGWLTSVATSRSRQLGQHLTFLEERLISRATDCPSCRKVARGLAEVVMDAAYAMLAVAPAPVEEDYPSLLAPEERPSEAPACVINKPPLCLQEIFARAARASAPGPEREDTAEFKVFHYWHGRIGDLNAFKRAMAYDGDEEMAAKANAFHTANPPGPEIRELFEELLEEAEDEVDLI